MITSETRERPAAAKYAGWLLVACTVPLLVGGALRWQSNMIHSGLIFLSLGLILAPDLFQRGWPLRLGIVVLVCAGVTLTFLT
jgi:hypothetical protein